MQVKRIGNYTILNTPTCKQVYSQKRMLQVGNNNQVYYVDLDNNKVIKTAKRIMKWLHTNKLLKR